MIFFKKLLKYLLLLIVLLAIVAYMFANSLSPTYKGELELTKLKEKVEVYYDDHGVPHIYGKTDVDAYRALGYVHAQDRLWQMELMRRIMAGRLSEIFGKDMFRIDKFMGGLGIEEAAQKTIARIDKTSEAYVLTMAYLEGVNQFIDEGPTPLEFYLLGIDKEPYDILDVYNVIGYMSFSFAIAYKTDPLLNTINDNLGPDYLEELLTVPSANATFLKTFKKDSITAGLSKAVVSIMNDLPAPAFRGSNSWVLGPNRTKNGKVIFSNDPHINFAQPSVWYQNHIKTPTHEMYGFNLPLVPYPLLGHNKNYAYGLTMLCNDDVDFYVEENNPENDLEYKTAEGYERYQTFLRKIKIKGGKDTIYKYKVSKHGTIMNDVIDHIDDKRPIAMQWIYTKLPNNLLEANYHLSHATSLNDFKENGVKKIHAPGLNIMYGDAKNNIAWFGAAKLYQYRDSLNTKIYLNGASGKDEILRYLDFDENPQAENPKSGYVYSANNQPDSIANMLYPGYYATEDRAKRIVNLIEPKNNFTKDDVLHMITDAQSDAVAETIQTIGQIIHVDDLTTFEKEAFILLKQWQGDYKKTTVGPTIYTRFLYEYLSATFKDELGNDGLNLFMNTTLQKKVNAIQLNRSTSVWWDNINTKNEIETREQIITESFRKTVQFLRQQLGDDCNEWQWENVLSLEHEHPIGKGGEILRKIFNVGVFKVDGGNSVINNYKFSIDSTGYYKVKGGPSTRRVIDFSDIKNSHAILPTGQSGNRFSPYYKDQAEKYHNNEFVKMLLSKKEIQQTENRLVFLPLED